MDKKPKEKGKYSDIKKLVFVTGGIGAVVFLTMFLIVFSVFSNKSSNSNYKYNDGKSVDVKSESGKKINMLGLIQRIDTSKGEIIVTNLDNPTEQDVRLSLVNYTEIKDEYNELMVIGELELGDIADIKYADETKKVEEMKLSGKVWETKNIKNIEIDQNKKTIKVKDKVYNFENKIIKSYKGEKIVFSDLNTDAIVSLKGYGDNIWAIKVEKYYGYLTFINFESYIGADIEIDADVFKKIDPVNNIILSPGEHKLVIKREDIETKMKYIIIKEKEKTTVDLGDIEIKRGTLNFYINVDGYNINISNEDGSYDTDFSGTQIDLPYDNYNITLTKTGYKTVSKAIQITNPTTNFRADMYRVGEGAKIKIDANIAKSEVYIDDKYVGIVPINSNLSYGSHKIAIRSKGYIQQIRQIIVDKDDEVYNFTLEPDNPYANGSPTDAEDDVYGD